MTDALEYAVLGAHLVPPRATPEFDDAMGASGDRHRAGVPGELRDDTWFDAIDLVLRSADGRLGAFGVRCASYVMSSDDANRPWGSYVPLAVTLDLAGVHHWDFNEVMWLGPSPWPCLVWSNAECLSIRSLDIVFAAGRRERLLAGPEGRGLPAPDDVGVTVSPSAGFRVLGRSPIVSRAATSSPDDL